MTDEPPSPPARYDSAAKVVLLRDPRTYPDPPSAVERIETHMSWVFLTERLAYKLKKPVRYDFLDFSTPAARWHDCAEEVRLNRRLAPDVYLDRVALAVDAGGRVRLEGDGEPIDWLVKMRRLPAARMLDGLIRRRAVAPDEIVKVARLLGDFYRRSPPLPLGGDRYRQRLAVDIRANQRQLADPAYELPVDRLDAIHRRLLWFLQVEAGLFEQRAAGGHIVEGHGDLRPEHICLEPRPVIFDCLEFKRDFRLLDAVDELAFLALECERLGAAGIGAVLFAIYGEITGDRPAAALIDFYKTGRACLRARLAIAHIHELDRADWPKWRAQAVDYLRLAEKYSESLT